MKYYNIHGIVRVSSNVEGFIPKHFECKSLKNVDLEIREGDFEFNKKAHKKIDFKFYSGQNKAYFESLFYGRPIYKVLIANLVGRTKLSFTTMTRRIFGVHELIRMLLEIKLLQKGFTLVHAGGVAKENHGYLILGWSGIGKSSTIFGLAKERDFEIFGDDRVILSKGGEIYSYPEKAGVFYRSRNIQNLNIPLSKRLELMFRYFIARFPPFNRYMSIKMAVDLSNIVTVGEVAKLDKVYFLERGQGKEKLNKKIALNRIIASTLQAFFDHYLSNKMFYAYCYVNGFDPGYIEKNMRKILEKSIRDCSIIRSEKKDFYKYLK